MNFLLRRDFTLLLHLLHTLATLCRYNKNESCKACHATDKGESYVSNAKVAAFIILIFFITSTGCGLGPAPEKPPAPVSSPQQADPSPAAESAAVTAAVQSAVRSFLSNDFAAAQKTMRLLPSEQKDPKTQRMFTDFSLHLNKRLTLEAKDAGLKNSGPVLSVANVRAAQTPDSRLTDVSIQAADALEPVTLIVKATEVSGVWLVDFAPFMLALMDALEEQ